MQVEVSHRGGPVLREHLERICTRYYLYLVGPSSLVQVGSNYQYLVLYKSTKSRIEASSGSPMMNFSYVSYKISTFLLIQSVLLPDIKISGIYK